jgi:hypothetical protein
MGVKNISTLNQMKAIHSGSKHLNVLQATANGWSSHTAVCPAGHSRLSCPDEDAWRGALEVAARP